MKYAEALRRGEWLRRYGGMRRVDICHRSYSLKFVHCDCPPLGHGNNPLCHVSMGPYQTLAAAFTRAYNSVVSGLSVSLTTETPQWEEGPTDSVVFFRALGTTAARLELVVEYNEPVARLTMPRHAEWRRDLPFTGCSKDDLLASAREQLPSVREMFVETRSVPT